MRLSVVIPSNDAGKLTVCIHAIREQDPTLPIHKVIVVDDGLGGAKIPACRIYSGVKPFIFSRNVNIGIRAAEDDDVIVLNDDARLVTPDGFTEWHDLMRKQARYQRIGVCAAEVRGMVGVAEQQESGTKRLRNATGNVLAFVCAYLPRTVINAVGLLDEQFVGYGFDDFDYCIRVQQAGYTCAINGRCVVEHTGHSAYRSRPDLQNLFLHNMRLYRDKWVSDVAAD